MKTIYFDTFSGASGNMIIGALLDAGIEFGFLKSELEKLNLKGYELTAEKIVSKGISGTAFNVKIAETHHHRGINKIFEIIDASSLSEHVKTGSKKIFQRLGEAEAKIHNKDINEIHFHEVGAVDAIIDIVGAVICFEKLGIEEFFCSKLHLGSGTVKCAHGILPVPAPATLELIQGIPAYSGEIETELTTPTGAAILTTFCKNYGPMPQLTIGHTGYGFGTKELPIANFLRVFVGESSEKPEHDLINILETNIDDMNPEFYEYVMEKLFEAGALDVYMQQVIMKKQRPGIVLTVLCAPEKVSELSDIIFNQTTTLGIRISDVKKRIVLNRQTQTVSTKWGEAGVKVRIVNGQKHYAPEYQDCKKIASENKIPIQQVYDEIKKITAEND